MTYKQDLVQQVIMGIRQYGISNVLFRNVIAAKLGVNSTDIWWYRLSRQQIRYNYPAS